MVYLVTYELKGHRNRLDYERLAEQIKSISGTWMHMPESKWFIETEFSAQQISGRLAPLTLIGDLIFVTRLYRDWSGYSLTPDQIAWLQVRNFNSAFETALASLVPLPISRSVTPLSPLFKAIGGL